MTSDATDAEPGELMTEAVADHELSLDELSVAELVTMMNDRDAAIPGAVREALPVITAAIEATAARIRQGGRLIYVGAAPPAGSASSTRPRSRRPSAPTATWCLA